MTKKDTDLIKFREKYQNKWVALDPNTQDILASNKDLKELTNKLAKKNIEYVLEKVLPLNAIFIPTAADL